MSEAGRRSACVATAAGAATVARVSQSCSASEEQDSSSDESGEYSSAESGQACAVGRDCSRDDEAKLMRSMP